MAEPLRFAFLLLDGFPHISLSCAIEPLRLANLVAGEEVYRWSLMSLDGKAVTASNGLPTPVDQGLQPLGRHDQLMIVAGDEALREKSPALLSWLRSERSRGAKIGGICAGAWLLAKAGFLQGRDVALHWAYHDAFVESFPQIGLTKVLFVADPKFPTCSGGTATIDMMLQMIFQDHGRDLAIAVAEQLVCSGMRDGQSMQRLSVQFRHGVRNETLVRAVELMMSSIDAPLSSSEIAEVLGISCRQLERIFAKNLKASPSRYALELRLDRARNLLQQSEAGISEIAVACGFTSMSHFSKVYRGRFGHTPFNERQAAQFVELRAIA